MTDTQAIRDDLAYLRGLAQAGRQAPLLGGAILAMGGATFAAASVAHYAFAASSDWSIAAIWGVAFVVFMAGLWWMKARIRDQPGALAGGNRAFGVVWQGLGFAVFATFLALALASWRTGSSLPMAAIAPLVMALYGAGWWVIATVAERAWMHWVALTAFAATIALGLLVGRMEQYLVYAVALVLTVVAPGALLMRAEAAAAREAA